MSTPLKPFCNREFVEDLEELTGSNVLLLLVDGSTVFGRIGIVEDYVVRVVPAVGIAGLLTVQFRPPNPTLVLPIVANSVVIDVCDIAHIVEGPFVISPLVALAPGVTA